MTTQPSRPAKPLALITGAAGGIGDVTTRRFLAGGYKVAAVDLDAGRVREVFAGEADVIAFGTDLEDTGAIHDLCRDLLRDHGAPRTIVNNAAFAPYLDSTQPAAKEWQKALAVNVIAPAALAWELIPSMLDVPGPSIVNVTSRNALSSSPRHAAYDASKAALGALTRTLAVEFGPQGLRVNSVCPGVVMTPLHEKELSDPVWSARYRKLIPLDRFASPADIANAIFFLASDEAAFISGQALLIDGGQLAGQNFGRIFDTKNC
jgi:NAD(P)-dependent dehydrogenase (short-subunit alcohol dehydrogenase family)